MTLQNLSNATKRKELSELVTKNINGKLNTTNHKTLLKYSISYEELQIQNSAQH